MAELTTITTGLRFPEGPVALPDGTFLVVELFGPRLTRVLPDGTKQTVADIPGGPNGAAIGPDGAVYLCNNGGCFTEVPMGDLTFPGGFDASKYIGGSIQRVDLATGEFTTLYTECDGHPLRAPNDLVMDGLGGFYFTDHGIRDHHARTSDLTGIYYATCDGSKIVEVAFPVEAPNGIGLSPDGTKLYWAETISGRVFVRDVAGPGELVEKAMLDLSGVLCGLPGFQLFDSLAVDGAGNICVATLINGGITVISPAGDVLQHIATGDMMTTNLCFGGPDHGTAYLTLSATGQLVSMPWPYPGLRLHHL